MTWDAIGAIAELIGAAAVVLTLLYLARETAKNSKSIDATSSRSIALHLSTMNTEIARDPVLSSLFLKSYQKDLQEFSEEEWFRFTLAATALMQTWQSQLMHGNLKLGDNDEVELNVKFTSSLIKTCPAWTKYWQSARELFPSSFVEKIEKGDSSHIISEMLSQPDA